MLVYCPGEEDSMASVISLISDFLWQRDGGFCSELSWQNFISLRMEKPGAPLGTSAGE